MTINLIPDDIFYGLCLNPNIWATLIVLYWLVTLNIWFGYNMPFYKTNTLIDLPLIHSCPWKQQWWGRKRDAKSGSWFELHNFISFMIQHFRVSISLQSMLTFLCSILLIPHTTIPWLSLFTNEEIEAHQG